MINSTMIKSAVELGLLFFIMGTVSGVNPNQCSAQNGQPFCCKELAWPHPPLNCPVPFIAAANVIRSNSSTALGDLRSAMNDDKVETYHQVLCGLIAAIVVEYQDGPEAAKNILAAIETKHHEFLNSDWRFVECEAAVDSLRTRLNLEPRKQRLVLLLSLRTSSLELASVPTADEIKQVDRVGFEQITDFLPKVSIGYFTTRFIARNLRNGIDHKPFIDAEQSLQHYLAVSTTSNLYYLKKISRRIGVRTVEANEILSRKLDVESQFSQMPKNDPVPYLATPEKGSGFPEFAYFERFEKQRAIRFSSFKSDFSLKFRTQMDSRQSRVGYIRNIYHTPYHQYVLARSYLQTGTTVGQISNLEHLSVGRLHHNRSNFGRAIELFELGLNASSSSIEEAEFSLELGRSHSFLGELDVASKYLKSARLLLEESDPKPEMLLEFYELNGDVLAQQNNFKQAFLSWAEGARIRSNELDEGISEEESSLLHRGGVRLLKAGNAATAIECFNRAIAQRRLATSKLDLADSVFQLSMAAYIANDNPLAVKAAEEAERIFANSSGAYSAKRLDVRNHQIFLNLHVGNNAVAHELAKELVQWCQILQRPVDEFNALHSLFMAQQRLGLTDVSTSTAKQLFLLGESLKKQGKISSFEWYSLKSLAAKIRNDPQSEVKHLHEARIFVRGDIAQQTNIEYRLATAYFRLGDLSKSRDHYRNLAKLSMHNNRSQIRERTETALAKIALAFGDVTEARQQISGTVSRELRYLRDFAVTRSEAEVLAREDYLTSSLGVLLSTLDQTEPDDARLAYKYIAAYNSIIWSELARRKTVGVQSENPAAYRSLKQIKSRIAAAAYAQGDTSNRNVESLANLFRQREQLERELAKQLPESPWTLESAISLLQAKLPNDAVLVHFLREKLYYRDSHSQKLESPEHYYAFVVNRVQANAKLEIKWIDLGLAQPIDEAVHKWRKSLLDLRDHDRGLRLVPRVDPNQSLQQGNVLRQLVWSKLERQLPENKTVVLIPDGSLHRVPWAAIPDQRPGNFLVHRYRLATLPNIHHIGRIVETKPSNSDQLLAVGGIKFDEAPQNALKLDDQLAFRSSRSALGVDNLPDWPFLPATDAEIQELIQLYPRGAKRTELRGSAASESSLRKLMPNSRYVHIATHGFFADARFNINQTPVFRSLAAQQFPEPTRATAFGRSPLLLTGLVTAGANVATKRTVGTEFVEDGILTAEEIVDLDLQNTDLVVLSGCETGLGDVADGRGVYGLQRAFALAGSRSIVTSLWSVEDQKTKALMVEFYKNLWQRKLGNVESLRQAQIAMLEGRLTTTAAGGKKPIPIHTWAGWVVNGDWR
jgi:CHAT domain-containing protein/tetratricopeptide (TPR) repeat protein